MFDTPVQTSRQAKVEAMLALLRNRTEATLRKMAELLVDAPDEQFFNQTEFDLRDRALDLATDAQQAALEGGKKRATEAPASSAPTALTTPTSSTTGHTM